MGAPGMHGGCARPFGGRSGSAVLACIALERQKTWLRAGHRLHARGIGGIGCRIDIATLAVPENDEEHGASHIASCAPAKAGTLDRSPRKRQSRRMSVNSFGRL